jgi:flagellar biogenesis protein FliO
MLGHESKHDSLLKNKQNSLLKNKQTRRPTARQLVEVQTRLLMLGVAGAIYDSTIKLLTEFKVPMRERADTLRALHFDAINSLYLAIKRARFLLEARQQSWNSTGLPAPTPTQTALQQPAAAAPQQPTTVAPLEKRFRVRV